MESWRRMGMSRARNGELSSSTPTNITMVNSTNASAHRCISGMKYGHIPPAVFVVVPNQYKPTSASATM